jgi:hypothetical protein
MMKSRRIKWLGFMMCGRDDAYRILFGDPGRRNDIGLLE